MRDMKNFLKVPGMYDLLQYRSSREKRSATSVEDIFDGTEFQKLQDKVGLTESDFTYTFNTDGFSLSESPGLTAWPSYLRLNEAPPSLRQKTIFLVALFISYKEPDFTLYLPPVVDIANRLSTDGLRWRRDGFEEDTISRFFPTCNCVDAKCRAPELNMTLLNGYYGCTFCGQRGMYLGGSIKYPVPGSVVVIEKENEAPERIIVRPAADRTDESIRAGMMLARPGSPVEGIKGPSELMNWLRFDLREGFSIDDLHCMYEEAAAFHTDLLMSSPGEDYYIGTPENLAVISARLSSIMTPTKMTRKPRVISTRAEWKATEWRNWFLMYAIPCLDGLFTPAQAKCIKHLALLSIAVLLLSRDVIEEADFVEAERCLKEFVSLFQEYFGAEKMRYNIHLLSHTSRCARGWMPFPGHSTFGFESRNRLLQSMVKSPNGAIDQIVRRYSILNYVTFAALDENVSEDLRDNINAIMSGHKTHGRSVKVGSARLFHEVVRREPSDEERMLLGDHVCDSLVEYQKVLHKNVECRSVVSEDDGARSDDRHVYTYDDKFCTILSIVVLEGGEHETCSLFVEVHDVGDPLMGINHIVPLSGPSPREFVPISSIRNSAVQIVVGEVTYMVPMHNQSEID